MGSQFSNAMHTVVQDWSGLYIETRFSTMGLSLSTFEPLEPPAGCPSTSIIVFCDVRDRSWTVPTVKKVRSGLTDAEWSHRIVEPCLARFRGLPTSEKVLLNHREQ